jgi:hypothetical protein
MAKMAKITEAAKTTKIVEAAQAAKVKPDKQNFFELTRVDRTFY